MDVEPIDSADVVIVGGGLIGCATAYFLARAGVDVTLVEAKTLNAEASGTNAGSLHLQIYVHPHFPDDYIERSRPAIALMHEAAGMWATLESDLEADCGVRLGGGLWLAETREEMALIETKVAAENSMGVESEILSRSDVLDFAPYLTPSIVGGSRLRGEGFADPLRVTSAYVAAARAAGARFIEHAPVDSVERAAGGWRLSTTKGQIRAGRIVLAPGAWLGSLARSLGMDIPIRASTAQVNVTERRPRIMRDQLIQHIGKGLTLKQPPHGAFIVGGGWPGAYDRATGRKTNTHDSIVGNAWVAAHVVPALATAHVVRSWAGMGSWVDDGMPIIGSSSAAEGVDIAYSGLGFSLGPIVARLMSERILGGDVSIPLEPFSPDRFA